MEIDRIDDDLAKPEPEFDGGPLCNKEKDAEVCILMPSDGEPVGLGYPELGIKDDKGKPRLELIAPFYELGMARVMAKAIDSGKYKEEDWRKGRPWKEYIGAAKRHLNAIARGEDIDPDSGEQHAYHLGCCAMILSEYMRLRRIYGRFDDRCKDATSNDPTTFSNIPLHHANVSVNLETG